MISDNKENPASRLIALRVYLSDKIKIKTIIIKKDNKRMHGSTK
jgi:hypothetical protein